MPTGKYQHKKGRHWKLSKQAKINIGLGAKKVKHKPTQGFQKGHKGMSIPKGEEHWEWKGEEVSYIALHKWVVRCKGNPKVCEHCGKIGKITGDRWNIEWANIDHKYRRFLQDFIGLCRTCHCKYDKKNN